MSNVRLALIARLPRFSFCASRTPRPPPGGATSSTTSIEASTFAEFADGEVRKVHKDSKKLTLQRVPQKNLDMPGMTMVFRVSADAISRSFRPATRFDLHAEKIEHKVHRDQD